jgi:transposase
MEATGIYWEEVAQFFASREFKVSVVNPVQIKAYGKSPLTLSKTDVVDAKLIANFCFARQPALWQARSYLACFNRHLS